MNNPIASIPMGRQGHFYTDGSLTLEVQAFAGNKPYVELITGVAQNRALRTQRVYPHSQPRSGGKNGSDHYRGLPDGLYRIHDILDTGSHKYSTTVMLENGTLETFSKDEMDDLLEERFPDDMALVLEAERVHQERLAVAKTILAEIAEERKAMMGSITEGDLVAHPEFRDAPTAEDVVKAMRWESFDRDQYVMYQAAPTHYIIHQPVFAKSSTSNEVFAQARTTIAARQAQLEAAKGQAEAAGWPALKGTEKQVRWAESIRAKVAAKDPNAKALKTATTAKYWIENHRFA